MVRNGEIALADVKRILKRYWWIPALTTIVCAGIGLVVTHFLPKKYTSSTIVMVEEPMVPADIVKPIVNNDLNGRLASMRELVLSRSRLQPIIEKLNLYPKEREHAHAEDLVEQLRDSIEVELSQPMPGSIQRQPPGFHVSVTFDNALLAQQICTEVTSMFMDQNLKRRDKQSTDTNQFLGQQLNEAKAKMDEQDAKLAEFKRKYLGTLPEEQQTNLSIMAGMGSQLDAVTQALNRAQQERDTTETMLNLQEANWKALQLGSQKIETSEQQLEDLQDQLNNLLLRYTPEHPDVVKVKAQIEDLKRKLDEDPTAKNRTSTMQAKRHEPAQLQLMRLKMKQEDSDIADLIKKQTQTQERMRMIQGRVEQTPMVEQQFKELTRDYEAAFEFYNNLLKNQANAAMATDLEHQQESETFKVLDPPSLPSAPSFPKKIVFVGDGSMAGLALGLAILGLLAMNDKSMYTERDIETCLKLPVLTMVPSFDVAGAGTGRSGQSLP
jgi:polysaccharide chain length determinant protein (PEP-CTERM system associated)